MIDETPFYKFIPYIVFGFVLGAVLGGAVNLVLN